MSIDGKFIAGKFIDFVDSDNFDNPFVASLIQKNPIITARITTIVHKIIFFLLSGKFLNLAKKTLFFSAIFIVYIVYGCKTTISIPSFDSVDALTLNLSCGTIEFFPMAFKNFATSSSFILFLGKA